MARQSREPARLREDLDVFLSDLEDLRNGHHDIAQMRVILGKLFGERPAQTVVDDLVEAFTQAAANRQVKYGNGIGGLSVAAPTILRPSTATPMPKHNNFGDSGEEG